MVLLHPSGVHQYYIMSEATPAVSQPERLVKSLSQQIMETNLGFKRVLKRDFILFFKLSLRNKQSFLKPLSWSFYI